ncbi:zinc ribbon domain-containing protein [Halobaculum marinum]|uniref:Zinc ribbon domain-containing protein n=1 Tax=Halobaculum marinum TaxID=3031996 RepID=A0ABD5WRM1_9EURY|nr:zinc ribbon domain-containing protein [Halobaculum sp. DT55]
MIFRTSDTQTCPDCRTEVAAGDQFCSACGAFVDDADRSVSADGGDARGHTVRHEDRAWLRRYVSDREAEGWTTLEDDDDRVVLRKRGVGRLPLHVVAFLLSGGLGNLLYATYSFTLGAPRRTVHADGTVERSNEGPSVDLLTVAGVGAGLLALFVAAAWVVFALLASLSTAALVAGALLFVLVSVAAMLAPGVLREGVKPVTTFGTEKTVERERVRNPPEACAACERRIFHGERRWYAKRRYVAGVPVGTTAAGENVYCAACADEVSGQFGDDDIEAELARMRRESSAGAAADRGGDRERERELESQLR